MKKKNKDKLIKIYEEIPGMGHIKFESLKDKNKKDSDNPIKRSKYIRTISYQELEKLINNEYIFSLLKRRNKIRIFESNPINLTSKYRYDVFIKYYYVQAYLENKNYKLAQNMYLEHIKSFNNFIEPDGKKKGKKEFIENFNTLINDIKINGINKTIIPITKNGEIIDGAHRLAIALYLNIKIQFAIFDLLDANYSKEFFLNRGYNLEYIKIIDKEEIKK